MIIRPWPPKSQQRHQARRDLDIAAQCFAQRSCPAASMNDIAAAVAPAGAAVPTTTTAKKPSCSDLLDRYAQRLLAIISRAEATANAATWTTVALQS